MSSQSVSHPSSDSHKTSVRQPAYGLEPPRLSLSRELLIQCKETLESLVKDRGSLSCLSDDERRGLMIAAGLFAKPDRDAVNKLRKSFRRQKSFDEMCADRAVIQGAAIRQARVSDVFVPPPQSEDVVKDTPRTVNRELICYVCKTTYREMHFFYDAMCQDCGVLNYQKRFQTADLRGRKTIITGARVKIGYQAALMLLRAGSQVIVTTRFPHDAAKRFSQEKDFHDWSNKLHIYGLDLRHSPSVEVFTEHMVKTQSGLDFLLNNAAQTVRRPRGFFRHLIAEENLDHVPSEARALLVSYYDCKSALESLTLPPGMTNDSGILTYAASNCKLAEGLVNSAAMSQLALLPDDIGCGTDVFPEGRYDQDLQQVDLRDSNSWRMRLAEVPTAELLEIQLINAIAPFILCSKLKTLMLRSPSQDKHIVNVSAMEGKFTRFTKTDKHPHTNMAKAALNMMTQTSAPDYVRDGIHMNAVDTGWVTDEDPAYHATRKRDVLNFQPPLDIVDGAARICDPIFSGLNSGEHQWGKFLKDYSPTAW